MKRVCLFLLISVCIIGYGQRPDTMNRKGFKPKLIPNAGTAKKIIQLRDSVVKNTIFPQTNDSQLKEEASRNIDAILRLQKEQRAKQKRNALIRIGIGIFFLIVLVIGLARKRRKK